MYYNAPPLFPLFTLIIFPILGRRLTIQIFAHPAGEVWKINSSPHDERELVVCYSTLNNSHVAMKTAIHRLPDLTSSAAENKEFLQLESTELLDTEQHGNDIKTTEFHATDKNLLATVIDDKILLHERTPPQTRIITEINTKNSSKLTAGKWSQTHTGNQFIALVDCDVRAYDVRDPKHYAWSIEEAHGQTVRDLDCNPHKHCHFVTGGDDGVIKIWDNRHTKEPVFVASDHQHWYVCVWLCSLLNNSKPASCKK